MANTKITSLTDIAAIPASNDVIPIVDVSDTTQASTGTTKKITTNRFVFQNGGSANLQGAQAYFKSEHPSGTAGMIQFGYTTFGNSPVIQSNIAYTGSGDPTTNSTFTTPNKYGAMIRQRGDVGGWYFFDAGQSTGFGSAATLTNIAILRRDACWMSPRGTNTDLNVGSAGNVGIGVAGNSAGNKLEVVGTVQMDGIRLDQTPTAGAVTTTHYITINANGTTYRIPVGTA